MKIKWILPLLMVIFATVVTAEQEETRYFNPGEVIDLSVHLTNNTGTVSNATCTVEIKNESYSTVHLQNLTEVGEGWYNGTYNTTTLGIYKCTQECSKNGDYVSGTCNFTIKGSETMGTAIIIGLIFIILAYIVLLRYFSADMFGEHGLIRMFIFLAIFWILLIPMFAIQEFNKIGFGSTGLTAIFDTLYLIMIVINVVITFYVFLWFFVKILEKFRGETEDAN